MGKKTYISAVTMPLMVEQKNRSADIVLGAVISGESIAANLVNESLGNMANVAGKAYRYAKDYYTLGLPSGQLGGLQSIPDDVIREVIVAELGKEVAIDYAFIDILNAKTVMLPFLVNTRGYGRTDNAILTHPFTLTPTFEIPVLVGEDMLSLEKTYPVLLQNVDMDAEGTQVTLYYTHEYHTYTENDGQYMEYAHTENFSEVVAVPADLVLGGRYVICYYFTFNALGELDPDSGSFWFYQMYTNVHPTLEVDLESFGSDAFMPVIPIRRNNIDLTTIDDELYQTSKKLLKKIKLDIDALATQLNANPSIADIDHAYIMFGIDAGSEDLIDLRYLIEYFDYLSDVQKYTQFDYSNALATGKLIPATIVRPAIYRSATNQVTDLSLLEYSLNIEISFSYISSIIKVGVIGPLYHATKEHFSESYNIATGNYTGDAGTEEFVTVTRHSITYRLQITPTQYKEVCIYDPSHRNYIYTRHAVVSDALSIMDPLDKNFIIPVHYGIAQGLPLLVRNQLFNNSLVLVINSYEVVKLEWYESSFFKFLVMAVGVIVTVISAGGTTGWMAGLSAAFAKGVGQLLMNLVFKALIAVALSFAFKLVVNLIGVDAAMILGAVLAIFSIFKMGMGSTGMNPITGTTTAQMCMSAAMSLMEAARGFVLEQLQEVQNEYIAFQSEADAKTKELEEAQALLDTRSDFNPLYFIQKPLEYTNFNETPGEFYQRTVHQGNIGTVALDVISNYYDIMLKLPEPDYT